METVFLKEKRNEKKKKKRRTKKKRREKRTRTKALSSYLEKLLILKTLNFL